MTVCNCVQVMYFIYRQSGKAYAQKLLKLIYSSEGKEYELLNEAQFMYPVIYYQVATLGLANFVLFGLYIDSFGYQSYHYSQRTIPPKWKFAVLA